MEEEQINNEIQNLVDQARNKFGELEDQYNKFGELRTELQNKAQGIRNFYSNANGKVNSIESLFNDATNKNKELETVKTSINEIKNEIDTYYSKFDELRTQLDGEDDGLEANFNWVKEKRDEVNKKYEEVIKIHTNSDNLLNQIKTFLEESKTAKDDSLKLKEEIAKWLDLISDSSRFNKFNERKKQLTVESYIWMALIVLGFLGLAIFIYAIFKDANGDFLTTLNKSLYTTPIIFFLLWATRNYSDVRGYLEKYSFKAIMSVSLSSYLELLESKFGRDCKELEKFSFARIKQIFIEPYKEKERKQLVNFLGGKIILENSEKPIEENIKNELDKIEDSNE